MQTGWMLSLLLEPAFAVCSVALFFLCGICAVVSGRRGKRFFQILAGAMILLCVLYFAFLLWLVSASGSGVPEAETAGVVIEG